MKELDYHANRMSKIYANIIQRAEELEAKDKNIIQELEHKIETDTIKIEEIISTVIVKKVVVFYFNLC
jgi:hypothetical protein